MNISDSKNKILSTRTSDKKYAMKTVSSRTNEKTFSEVRKNYPDGK
ncbi:hypothetical protein [Flavobacterium reichenbachii]|nr:hypothetical protein [Flavobacterium reichenbachii]